MSRHKGLSFYQLGLCKNLRADRLQGLVPRETAVPDACDTRCEDISLYQMYPALQLCLDTIIKVCQCFSIHVGLWWKCYGRSRCLAWLQDALQRSLPKLTKLRIQCSSSIGEAGAPFVISGSLPSLTDLMISCQHDSLHLDVRSRIRLQHLVLHAPGARRDHCRRSGQ